MHFRSIKLEYILIGLLFLLAFYTFWTKHRLESATKELEQLTPGRCQNDTRILCWILSVQSRDHMLKSRAVQETWGRRCDKLIIVRNGTRLEEREDGEELLVPLGGRPDSRSELWHKVVAAFTHIRSKYLDQYDWFMKADDDTYVLVESLKQFLSKSSPELPVYFGHKFKPFVRQGYMSGGAGYVLSRASLRMLVDEGYFKRRSQCHVDEGIIEDVEMGKCLEALGVEAGDTRDNDRKPTFLALSPLMMNTNSTNLWYNAYEFYKPAKVGRDRYSNQPITFHYITPQQMYFIDWLLYQVRRPFYSCQVK